MQTGDRVLGYVLERKLGDGGMSVVFLGQHTEINQQVAIKVLLPMLARDQEMRTRFIQEANIQAQLDHPYIVKTYNVFTEGEQPALVMEYVDGRSLSEVLKIRTSLPVDDALKIMKQVLSAVGYAHQKGVIHRDLKPSNVMVLGNGKAKITDFGIAKVLGSSKLTRTGTAMGTAHYMSPEQIRRPETVDAKSDIYSLGCVFYEMLTGRPPFGEKDASATGSDFEIQNAHINETVDELGKLKSDVPKWLAQSVMSMLEKEPEKRPANCEAILEQLESRKSIERTHESDAIEIKHLNSLSKIVIQHISNTPPKQGTYTCASGDKYVGEFKDGNFHGQGTYFFLANNQFKGDKYVGNWKDDKRNGQGTYTFANGDKYVGEFKDDNFHGQGITYSANGSIAESGIYKDDVLVKSQYIDPNSFTRIARNNSASDHPSKKASEIQLMWLSGTAGHVRTISISSRSVLLLSGLLVFCGFLLFLIVLKIAVHYKSEFTLGRVGVITEDARNRLDTTYRDHLSQMKQSMGATVEEIRQLETMKNRFTVIATPTNIRDKINRLDNSQSGSFVPPLLPPSIRLPLDVEFDQTLKYFLQIQRAVLDLRAPWEKQLNWLNSLPTGIPVLGDYRFGSAFGIRNDPLTGGLDMHEGVDFTAPTGTLVVSTAQGTVTRSGWDPDYGNVIEVHHAEGFATRYAHLNKRTAQVGDMVERGGTLGEVGSTGRSTGPPHLHYEVWNKDKVINPAQVLPNRIDDIAVDSSFWVSKLDDDTWVLQHGAFDSLAEAKAFQANSSLFKSAQVLFSQRKGGKSFYTVVSGPYADKDIAETQMRQNPAMAKAWLRTSKSLKAQFQD